MQIFGEEGEALRVTIKLRTASSIAVNLCKLELPPCEDHPSVVRGMLVRLIGEITAAGSEKAKTDAAHERIKGQLLASQVCSR